MKDSIPGEMISAVKENKNKQSASMT